jgi:hypothetical protein
LKLVHDSTINTKPRNPVEAALTPSPSDVFIDLSECLRLVGGSAANGDNTDPIVLQGDAELKFRRLIAMFGFDRLPFTYGEAHGLLDYCQRIDSAAGISTMEPHCLEIWQQAGFRLFEVAFPHLLPALKLFCKGDLAGLRALHKAEDTLARLGKAYWEFSVDE